MSKVFLSIGSNVLPEDNVRRCLDRLRREFGTLEISPIYRCAAVGFEGDDFLNLVVGLETEREPQDLFDQLKTLEDQLGRRRASAKYSDRNIDIDLLLHGDRVGSFDGFTLPRDEILKYAFVLMPLADLAAELVHPVTEQTLDHLWQEMSKIEHDLRPVEAGLRRSILG
jgi:2-amino-4-hydroxy-6-hydroxymethyldihydropteridine diphosphokinase